MKLAIVLNKIKQTERGKYFVFIHTWKECRKGTIRGKESDLKERNKCGFSGLKNTIKVPYLLDEETIIRSVYLL